MSYGQKRRVVPRNLQTRPHSSDLFRSLSSKNLDFYFERSFGYIRKWISSRVGVKNQVNFSPKFINLNPSKILLNLVGSIFFSL